MSAWKDFKKSIGNTPLALFNSQNKVPEQVAKDRMNTCLECEHFIRATKQCGKCFCFMEFKTTLKKSFCPIEKWTAYKEEDSTPSI
jgi:hypothetical protein